MNTENKAKKSDTLRSYIKRNIVAQEWYGIRTDLFRFMQTCIKEGHFTQTEQNRYEELLDDFGRFENAIEDNPGLNDTFKQTAYDELSLLYGLHHFVLKYGSDESKTRPLIELMEEAYTKCKTIERTYWPIQ